MEVAYLSTKHGQEWRNWKGRNIEVSNESLGLETEPAIEFTNLRAEAIDISIDQDGTVVILDDEGQVKLHDRESGRNVVVWDNEGDNRIEDARALCVFGERVYVADKETGEIVIISRRNEEVVGRIQARLDDPVDVIRTNQRIYILDGGTEDISGRVVTLRRNGMVETIIRGLNSPVDITADSGHLYVIEQEEGTPVIRIHDVNHVQSPSMIPTSETIDDMIVNGSPVIPIRVEVLTDQELVIVGRPRDEDQLALYHYRLGGDTGTLIRRDEFRLSCSKLLTGPRDQNRRYPKYYAIAGEQNHVYIIDEQQTNKRNPVDDRYSAQAFRRFDSGAVDTDWGRITLDFTEFPANTQVVTSYYATNDRTHTGMVEDIEGVTEEDAAALREENIVGVWELLEYDPGELAMIVGDETPERPAEWQDIVVEEVDRDEWVMTDSANQQDILLEGIRGQYLHVRLELIGGIHSSPQVGSFRAYCPKRTYLRYLPEQYQSNNRSNFLERYLSIFQSEYTDIEERIDRLTQYFDPQGVPKEYLSWLSSWLAIEYDDEWPAGAKREFLSNAPELFKQRGTKEGLARTIRLYLDYVEQPNTRWMSEWQKRRIEARRADGWLSDEEVGEQLRAIDNQASGHDGGHLLFFFEHLDLDGIASDIARQPYTIHMNGPRSFVAFVGPFVSRDHRTVVNRIVANERPAHTHGQVVELRQEMKLEGNSFLGVNSTLTTREFVLGRATLGGDSVLKERNAMV